MSWINWYRILLAFFEFLILSLSENQLPPRENLFSVVNETLAKIDWYGVDFHCGIFFYVRMRLRASNLRLQDVIKSKRCTWKVARERKSWLLSLGATFFYKLRAYARKRNLCSPRVTISRTLAPAFSSSYFRRSKWWKGTQSKAKSRIWKGKVYFGA